MVPDPGLRLFGDLDLVVPADQLHAATTVLGHGLGADAALPELRPGFDERFGRESLLRTRPTDTPPAGLEIDVHRTLVAGALGLTIPLDELFLDGATVTIANHHIPTLGVVPTFLLTCYQATIAEVAAHVAAARDLAQIVRSGSLDLEAAIATAGRWQARAVMAEAVTWAWRTLDLPDRPPVLIWAEAYRPTVRERVLLASHRSPGYVYWRQLAAVVVLPGIEPRLRYLAGVLAPQGSYLERRQWALGDHVRRAWRTLNRPMREHLVRMGRRFRRRFWPPG